MREQWNETHLRRKDRRNRTYGTDGAGLRYSAANRGMRSSDCFGLSVERLLLGLW
jgi:hypothetical protein